MPNKKGYFTLASRVVENLQNYKNKEPIPIYGKAHYAQKNRIEKIYKDYSSVNDDTKNKWSKDFFFSLFLEKNIFFISFNNPLEGYLIGRKIIDEYEILSLATDIKKRRRGVGLGLLYKLLEMAKKENKKNYFRSF